MARLGLALSGGGFRATLYHLGVVRFLRDVGELRNVTDIASVSGGTILAAHLAINWERYNGDDEEFAAATDEIVKFVRYDVRNRIVRRLPFLFPMRLLAKLVRRRARRFTPNAILEWYYEKFLYGDRCLHELPEEPKLHMLTTNVSNGGLSVFNREGLWVQQRSSNGSKFEHIAGQMATLPRVVGASSAFPGFFPPVEFTAEDLGVRDGQFPTESFTDGGVYDNLGTRAFSWLKQDGMEFDQVLVSDAGKPFQVLSDSTLSFVGQSLRASDILWDRVWQLEKDIFGKRPGFAFVPITQSVSLEEDHTALHPVIQTEVQTIRTDLDRFTPIEINALIKHGYEVCRQVYRERNELSEEHSKIPPWGPFTEASFNQDDGEEVSRTSQVTRLSRKLRESSRRRTWSTLLDQRDWTSYVYVALLIIAILIPIRIYDLYRESMIQATVIESIASGDPDIRRILGIVNIDPTADFEGIPISERKEASTYDYKNMEVLSHNRIIDLRHWDPSASTDERRGRIYVSDRLTVRFNEDYEGDKVFILRVPVFTKNIEFRQRDTQVTGTISRIAEPMEYFGEMRTLFEVQYDLSSLGPAESVDLHLEMAAPLEVETRTARFTTELKTDLVSVWMLFPSDRPYRTYNLVQYPANKSEAPEIVDARYSIDHPYGSLIGWSVVNPEMESVYECRWTHD